MTPKVLNAFYPFLLPFDIFKACVLEKAEVHLDLRFTVLRYSFNFSLYLNVGDWDSLEL